MAELTEEAGLAQRFQTKEDLRLTELAAQLGVDAAEAKEKPVLSRINVKHNLVASTDDIAEPVKPVGWQYDSPVKMVTITPPSPAPSSKLRLHSAATEVDKENAPSISLDRASAASRRLRNAAKVDHEPAG